MFIDLQQQKKNFGDFIEMGTHIIEIIKTKANFEAPNPLSGLHKGLWFIPHLHQSTLNVSDSRHRTGLPSALWRRFKTLMLDP